MKKTKKALASLAIAGMALTSIPFNVLANDQIPTRLSGMTAEQTAVAIADQTGYKETAILASSASYGAADALTAGPLAAYLKAPILLQGPEAALNADTKAELLKLGVKKVYVTSGTAVIKQSVVKEIQDMGITVESLGGMDRFDTAVNIAKKMVALGAPVNKVAVAYGWLNQDALSIAPIAAAATEPILLTEKSGLPASAKAFLAANSSIKTADVIGGTGVIADSVMSQLPGATRTWGQTAYDTNNKVIQSFTSSLKFDNVFVANGVTGIDALAGAPLAAMTNSPIVLTDGASVPEVATFTYSKNNNSVVTALGGAAVVSEAIRTGVATGTLAPSDDLAVNSVSVATSSSLTISGTGLNKLTASDITVADNTVSSYTVAQNGTSATVVLENALIVDQETAVTVKGKAFTVTYKVDATSVAVTSATYDNDTDKQVVAITVNGKATTVSDVIEAGYDVEFAALDAKTGGNDITSSIFKDETTGKLLDDLNPYLGTDTSKSPYVMVTLTKGSDVITSDLTKITIKNLDYNASSITDITLTNDTTGADQNSAKLVTGEQAHIKEIKVNVDGSSETINQGVFTVKSSDAGVVYTSENGDLDAVAPGTATLTVTYGNVTKTLSLTVVKDDRELTKVVVQKEGTETAISSLKIAKINTNVEIVAQDQFGDPMSETVYVKSSDTDIIANGGSVATTASDKGTVFALNPLDTGSTTLNFYSDSAMSYKLTGSLSLSVVENADVTKSVLELYTPIDDADAGSIVAGQVKDDFSTDTTIDMSDDLYVAFRLNQMTSDNVSLGFDSGATVEISQSKANVATAYVSGDYIIVKADTDEGSATITVTDSKTLLKYTKKITVVDKGNVINSVTWKSLSDPTYAKTYKYDTILTSTDSGNDPKITGINLTKSVSGAIRLSGAKPNNLLRGTLYVDKDGDGVLSSGDKELGTLDFAITGKTLATINGDGSVSVASGEDCTVTFQIKDTDGKIVAAKSIVDNF